MTTSDQRAEQAGAMDAARMLEAMDAAPTQAERITILHSTLCDAAEGGGAHLAGFATILIARLDRAAGIS